MINLNSLKNFLLATNYFIDNEYLTAYLTLITSPTIDQQKHCEKHHAIPVVVYRYYNGVSAVEARRLADSDPQNCLVTLLYKDHVLVHYLLYFCTVGKIKQAMAKAVVCMVGNLDIEALDLSNFSYLPTKFDKLQQLIDYIYADPTNNFYSPADIEFLKTYYPEKGTTFCAEQLGRDVASIRAKTHSLRLHYNTPQPWSEEELTIIKQHYEDRGPEYCADLLPHRTKNAVANMAKSLGLATRRLWTAEELDFLRVNYAILGGKGCAEALKKSYTAVRTKASDLKLQSATDVWSAEEIKFIKLYYIERGAVYCATHLGRSVDSVRQKACKFHLTTSSTDWNRAEIDFLKRHYVQDGVKFCVDGLPGRTAKAIINQANRLGLRIKTK